MKIAVRTPSGYTEVVTLNEKDLKFYTELMEKYLKLEADYEIAKIKIQVMDKVILELRKENRDE